MVKAIFRSLCLVIIIKLHVNLLRLWSAFFRFQVIGSSESDLHMTAVSSGALQSRITSTIAVLSDYSLTP